MEEFTIDRSHWLRGKGGEASALLKPNGLMCCIGFFCKAHGFADEEIRGYMTIMALTDIDNKKLDLLPEWSKLPGEIHPFYGTNDYEGITDAQREAKLIEMFANRGIKVTFVGE